MTAKVSELHTCSICGLYEPIDTLTEGVCEECIKNKAGKTSHTPKHDAKKLIPASYFFTSATITFAVGLYLILQLEQLWGFSLLLFITPCLLLYPIIRALFFGEDSILAVITTIFVEEYLKQKVKDLGKDKKKSSTLEVIFIEVSNAYLDYKEKRSRNNDLKK